MFSLARRRRKGKEGGKAPLRPSRLAEGGQGRRVGLEVRAARAREGGESAKEGSSRRRRRNG